MKKLLLLPLLLIVLLPLVTASEVCVDSYELGAQSASYASVTAVHPSSGAGVSAFSQSFRVRYDGANLSVVQLYGYQVSISGTTGIWLYATIEGHSGTWGSTGVTNGSVYATSNYVNVSSWSGVYSLVNFSFASGYVFDAASAYVLCVYCYNGSDFSSQYYGIDNSAPINHWGNFASYASSAWTASGAQDLVFYIYGDGGELVAYNVGGTYAVINQITEVTNVTSSPTVNVTTGDVNIGGVTAEFNNTTVDATGSAITAGDVTAGDVTAAGAVTANGAITMGGDLSVNGTFDNATLTYVTSTAVSGDANVYFLIAFIGLAVLLTFYNKVPLMNFLVGIVGISFITLSFQNTDLPFWPYSSVLLALVSLLCMISGGFKMRNN